MTASAACANWRAACSEDAATLAELGLIEKAENGKLNCPYADIHVDMHLR